MKLARATAAGASGDALMLTRRHALLSAAANALSIGLGAQGAGAQAIDKQTRMIVGFAAGGGTDVSARLFSERLTGVYASTIIVDNKVGVASRLAVEFVKNAPPDGGVMLFTPDFPVTLYPSIYKNLGYEPLRDLIPVAPLTKSSLVVSVGPQVPPTSGISRVSSPGAKPIPPRRFTPQQAPAARRISSA